MRTRGPETGQANPDPVVDGRPSRATAPGPDHVALLQTALRDADPDTLAKHLGLRSGDAATTLVSHDAARQRLAERMAEGAMGLTADEVTALGASLLGDRS